MPVIGTPRHHSTSARGARRVLALGAAAVLATTLVQAAPVAALGATAPPRLGAHRASKPAPAPASAPVVTLVSGQRIVLATAPNGVTTARLAPGSRASSVETMSGNGHHYVIPRMAPAVRRHLDVSLFDVTRLAELAARGPVGLAVRFAPGVSPRNLPGIRVDAVSATKLGNGQTSVRATYDASGPGRSATTAADWRGVARVALAPAPAKAPGDFVLHTLTIQVTDGGAPAGFADVWVQNVDNSALFNAPVTAFDGEARVSVPEGNYSVMGNDFGNQLAIDPDFAVTGDQTEVLDLSTATARPTVSVPGLKPFDASVLLSRRAEERGGFSWSLGSNRFSLRVTPVASVEHGSLSTTLSSSQAAPGTDPFGTPKDITYTKDDRPGIPATFNVTHQRSDFAQVTHRYFDNGRPHADLFVYGFTPVDQFAFIFGINTDAPSTRTLSLQGADDVQWLQEADGFIRFAPFTVGAQAPPLRSYGAGQKVTLDYFRAPSGPGLEQRNGSDSTGKRCTLCRVGDRLHGALPLWGSAGGSVDGAVFGSRASGWTLTAGRRVLDRGTGNIGPDVTLSPDAGRYQLTATVKPAVRDWTLGSTVADQWTFTSRHGTGVIPLLMPRYTPSSNLSQTVVPGRHSFRLDVGALGSTDPRITDATVRVSYNGGRTSTAAKVDRVDANSFKVSYRSPAGSGKQRYATLLVKAQSAGGSVTEVVERAYRLGGQDKAAPTTTQTRGPRADVSAGVHACKGPGIKHYRCFAVVEESGRAALTKAGDPAGWGATDLRDAYDLDTLGDSDQTVAVVVAYDYPTAEADLNKYRRQFGLPACTSESGCFTKINQAGEAGPYPHPDQGWALEAALDLQMISASCPTCSIVLAEARTPSTGALNKATDAAVAAGADVTNHSYGIQEYGGIVDANDHYAAPGSTAVTASGDDGYGPASFPASSPDVVSVGGTTLRHAANDRGWVERAWKFGGSGCSAYFDKPSYQSDPACSKRMFADLATAASDIAVYDSFGFGRQKGWFVVGGTSASSPFVAGMIGAARAGGIAPDALYGNPAAFRDITKGGNGVFMTCRGSYVCVAKSGYDGPTGWGSPRGLAAFTPPV